MDINKLVSENQSIKIVPSMEEVLKNKGLDVELDENTILWLTQLKETWKTWKRSPTIENHIEMFFNTRSDPFRVALVFIIKCEDAKDCKPKTLPYFIVEVLRKWSKANNVDPEDSLKLPAFHIAIKQRNQSFLCLVAKTYQISTIKESILPMVRMMIGSDNCKQACQIVIAMELFEDISVKDLLFPLILQDKANIIDEYLLECPTQVIPLIQFLDMLLDKNFSIREYVQKYVEEHNICNIKYDKIHHKPLGKLVARLCSKFKVPIESCKNLSKNRTTGGLRYLIHQKYQLNNVSSSVWDDLVKDSLRQNADAAQEFIDMLVDYDKNEALKWAMYINLPENNLPLALKQLSLQSIETEENWDTDEKTEATPLKYYKFSLTPEQIIMIDTPEKFYDLMISDLAGCSIISLDCEWKPSFGAKQCQVGLIQIATANNVYLIDSLVLNRKEYASFWHTFYKTLLDNAEIIKVGFGLEQDLKEMKASIHGLGNIKLKGEGLLDLCILWKNLVRCGLDLPGTVDGAGNSLTSLVQACFGLPLEKSEQCSNWELRPLRDTQIQYAALDAHVLIEIYYFLQKKCLEQQIDFEEICNEVTLERKKKCSKKLKVAERNPTQNILLKAVSDVKLFLEPSLSNLMAYLRYCGIDTILIPPTLLWCDIINLAISEDRLILTSKHKCTPTTEFPQSSILDIGISTVKEQLQKILQHYNIGIKQSDILSRCLLCNEKTFKNLNPREVVAICNEFKSTQTTPKTNMTYRDDYDEEDDFYDRFDSDGEEDMIQPVKHVVVNKSCVTRTGVSVDICNVENLSISQKPAVLCETCGKLFWDEDDLLKPISELVLSIINE